MPAIPTYPSTSLLFDYGNANVADPYSIDGMVPPSASATSSSPSLGAWGAGASAVGAVMSVIGAISAVQGQKASLAAQAEISRINAATAENAARSALMAGQREQFRSRLATANLKGKQEAAMAANGIDLGEGSAARIRADTDILGEIDANTIAANAVQAAWGYRTQGVNYANDARLKAASAGSLSAGMAGASSLLTNAGQVASNWYTLNRNMG